MIKTPLKYILIPFSVIIALSLTGCGSSMPKESSAEPSMTATEPSVTEHAHVLGDGTLATAGIYTLQVLTVPRSKVEGSLSFKIIENDTILNDFIERHTKNLHLVLVSEDLSEYIHTHPTMSEEGVWSVNMKFPEGGNWRLYADFGTSEEPNGVVLGSIINVAGTSTITPLEAPAASFSADGFDYTVSGRIPANDHGMLMITITKDGKNVVFGEYLGSTGHLVAIRENDGAYAHFHPQGHNHSSASDSSEIDSNPATPSEDGMGMEEESGSHSMAMPGMLHFDTEVPGAGKYRLFLEFMAEGKLHKIAFTADVV